MAASENPNGVYLRPLSGWGVYPRTVSELVTPQATAELRSALKTPLALRGLGRSYGDAAVNDGGLVAALTALDRYLAFDPSTGTLVAEAGVSLEQIIRDFAPRGFFPSITPGTKFVTLGGCVANDVHGKAHHAQGAFSACVDSMRILLADGTVAQASRSENSDLFWGTFGGMGLLGAVVDLTLRLRRIESTYFTSKAIVVGNLREMVQAMDEFDGQYPYSVAYVEPVAKGDRLGSGVLTVGDHAPLDALPPKLRANPLLVSAPSPLSLPMELPEFVLNGATIHVVNWLIMQLQTRGGPVSHYEKFFYPLDIARHWNRAYGRRGFTQYQFVIPLADGYERMKAILETIVSSGCLPFLNVLKRMGPPSGGLLSFPTSGFTFAIDFPVRDDLPGLLARLDQMVLEAGGRVYLGKDAFLAPDTFRRMYPAVEEWLTLKRRYDPNNRFTSSMARRLKLLPQQARLPQWDLSAAAIV